METIQLAKIDNFIRIELQRCAEYAIKFGTPAPRARVKNVKVSRAMSAFM